MVLGKGDDIFRDTKLRYLGYANEIGESLRVVAPPAAVRASYGIAFAYVLADTFHKSMQGFRNRGLCKAVTSAGDALIWQSLASVIIPGITINRICYFTNNMLKKHASRMPVNSRSMLTVAAGLVSIPFIVVPIDTAVSIFMNCTYRIIF